MADRKIEKAPFNSQRRSVLTLAAGTHSLTANESGRLLLVSDAGGTQTILNLPAVAEGLNYCIIATADVAHASGLQINTASNATLRGLAQGSTGGTNVGNDVGGANTDRLTLPQGADAGTKVELWCDGTSWFVYALTPGASMVSSFGNAQ